MLIVEANGKAYKVPGAKKLHGVGPFGGYNIFLNQKIKVELLFEGNPFQITADEVKSEFYCLLRNGMHGQLGEILRNYKIV
jgi:hypothetical protein